MIPSIIIHCVEEIESRGMEESGIYRIIAPDKEVIALKVTFIQTITASSLIILILMLL